VTVTAARGFVAAGVHCGIKPSGDPDLALVVTDDGRPVTAAAVFTRNLACAGPVTVSRRHLTMTGGRAAAVILNSGNANCATRTSEAVADEMCTLTAAELGCTPENVLVCSTGLIGIPLDPAPLQTGIPAAAAARSAAGGPDAAEAIRTTDTHRKEVVVAGDGFTVGGMAKGAAMLAPNMATMLAVLTTDASVADPTVLVGALRQAVDASFNRLTVDGCTSTNDTVIVLASGRAGGGETNREALTAALSDACFDLARQMNDDAEGSTHSITVRVTGAMSDADAVRAARKVAQSQLVKCSFYGKDPYWGRVLSELGSAGVAVTIESATIAYGDTVVSRGGVEVDHDHAAVTKTMGERHIELTCDLGTGGRGASWVLTNDLTHGYVDENMGTS
jgi:glutamate N-acetyltransferase / amino-acid N-acetyltransferase